MRLIFTCLLVLNSILIINLAVAQQKPPRPKCLINHKERPDGCSNAGGLVIESAFIVSMIEDEEVEVVMYFQTYNGGWERKTFSRKGSGELALNISSCDYTGNYFSFPYYKFLDNFKVPTGVEVESMHTKKGALPIFRVSEMNKLDDCKGTQIVKGDVFTPNGEEVKITLFLEKKDGHWRKKDYLLVGSGSIYLDIEDCDLTGKYKSKIQIMRAF
ncbi:MAG: hypothetical protein KTR26_08010 [Flammeovirgaceae bacterium]|nr:hypothetical protein [Flammeovirgaceae bacterium]